MVIIFTFQMLCSGKCSCEHCTTMLRHLIIAFRTWWQQLRLVDRDGEGDADLEDGELYYGDQDTPSDFTPATTDTPLQSSVSRCTSFNTIKDDAGAKPLLTINKVGSSVLVD